MDDDERPVPEKRQVGYPHFQLAVMQLSPLLKDGNEPFPWRWAYELVGHT